MVCVVLSVMFPAAVLASVAAAGESVAVAPVSPMAEFVAVAPVTPLAAFVAAALVMASVVGASVVAVSQPPVKLISTLSFAFNNWSECKPEELKDHTPN